MKQIAFSKRAYISDKGFVSETETTVNGNNVRDKNKIPAFKNKPSLVFKMIK